MASAGRPGMTKECKGETVYMPEAFGIKSGKSPNLASDKRMCCIYAVGSEDE